MCAEPTAAPPGGASPGASAGRVRVLITSYLTGLLKYAGPVCAPRAAAAFLERAGREREVFLPFFYRWFDHRQWAQDHALRLIKVAVAREGITPPSVFHAPFPGRRHGTISRNYYRDLADPSRVEEHRAALQRECAFLGRVRKEFGIQEQMVYILHLGLRRGEGEDTALRAALAAIQPAVEDAREHGVVLAPENVADRSGSTEHLGARLPEIGEVLDRLGRAQSDAPLGWTFDLSHALLAYRGDAEAITRDLKTLLPYLVHIHINTPRFYPSEQPWADRHEAPTEGFRPLWDLFRLALNSPRFRAFGGITYEVNWAAPFLNPLVGGSDLAAVVAGYDLVCRTAAEAFGTSDEYTTASYTASRATEA